MTRIRITKGHPFYDIYVAFHADLLSREERTRAKSFLYSIHYNADVFDTSEADAEVVRIKNSKLERQDKE